MAKKPRLGAGGRSKAMRKAGMSGALIGYLGRKKYGAKRMAKWSAAGRRRAARKRKR